jgi:tRNA (uracil-5-)-methyltransferase
MTQSDIPESSIPAIKSTIPSPLQYGYRTKITPHFEPPPKKLQKQEPTPSEKEKPPWLKIGFNQIGKRVVMDIEVRLLVLRVSFNHSSLCFTGMSHHNSSLE